MAIERVQAGRLLRDVRVCLDENGRSGALADVEDEDTLLLDDAISAFILESVKAVEMACSPWALDTAVAKATMDWEDAEVEDTSGAAGAPPRPWTTAVTLSAVPGVEGAVRALVPEDCMRMVAFRLGDWAGPCMTFLSAASPEYAMARSKYAALRGTPERPRVFLLRDAGGRVLEAHSTMESRPRCTQFVYVKYPTIDSEGGVDIATDCYDAVKWRVAAMVLQSRGEVALAQVFEQRSAELVP